MIVQRIPTTTAFMQELVNIKTNEVLCEGSLNDIEKYKLENNITDIKYQNPFTKELY